MNIHEPSETMRRTLAYYEERATEFVDRTVSVDLTDLYSEFVAAIPAGGRILDAGCGSGRDSLAFLHMGFDVISIDASPTMVEATTKLTGKPASLMSFYEMSFHNEFDAIWASASLLHIPRTDLPSILARLSNALRQGGPFYFCFKYGDDERIDPDGRFFNDLNEPLLRAFLQSQPELILVRTWLRNAIRPNNQEQRWINGLAKKGKSMV